MITLGTHIIAELSHCRPEPLADLDGVREAMVQAALEAGAQVREAAFHRFTPNGVSGVVVIAESHLSIHTWPDLGYAAIDLYTCGEGTDPWKACDYLARHFQSRTVRTTVLERGLPDRFGTFGHTVREDDATLSA